MHDVYWGEGKYIQPHKDHTISGNTSVARSQLKPNWFGVVVGVLRTHNSDSFVQIVRTAHEVCHMDTILRGPGYRVLYVGKSFYYM